MNNETYTAMSDATPVYYAEYDAQKEKTISLWVGLLALVFFWIFGFVVGMLV